MAKGKKTGGRVAGTPNKVTAEVRAAAQALFDAKYFTQLRVRILDGRVPPAVECRMLAYAFGEPTTWMDGATGEDGAVRRVVIELKDGRSQ